MWDGHANEIGSNGVLPGCSPLSHTRRVCRYALSRPILLLVLTFVGMGNVVDYRARSTPSPMVVATPSPTAGRFQASPQRPVVEALYGQPDQLVVDALPDLDPRALVDPEPSSMLPIIHLRSKSNLGGHARPDPATAALGAALVQDTLPDSLLLWSGDWYGPQLRRAAQALLPTLSVD